ncbi:hypothetical protein N7457_005774 [Penicillium paradoxum]|uniref:uncharacterized protein n=1 Tax=Penicillium paradoxum TaxID=176176 RepID=UPI0025478E5F|nr:uncharacterized protein N7457_005774 [Penicillium paradoxum]KAJ5780614.1 hypothetical protein N7457_005774 [Penicillium paradoxum]
MPIIEEGPEATTLDHAINEVSDKTVRMVLKSICEKNEEARKEAERLLLVTPTDSEGACQHCIQRGQYHEECEPTGEALWVDNDGDLYDVDTDEMRRDFPECFTFECCDGNLRDTPHGCVTDFHQERPVDNNPSKRARAN